MRLFLEGADFEAFGRIIEKTLETRPKRILAYCLKRQRSAIAAARKSTARLHPNSNN